MSVIDSTQCDSEGRATRLGSNQIGRYAVHFHHTFGPKAAQSNGHQFTAKLKVRGDLSALGSASESPVGLWVSNYVSKNVRVTDADVQGMRVGVLSPFFYNQTPERGGAAGSLLVENSYFQSTLWSIRSSYQEPDSEEQ